jgi:hypothetical protein
MGPNGEAGARMSRKLKRLWTTYGANSASIGVLFTPLVGKQRKGRRGAARYPTAAEIEQICQIALEAGIRYLDIYGYQIGKAGVNEDLDGKAPGTGPAYILTGQIPRTFLWDRPEIHDALGEYLRGLNS